MVGAIDMAEKYGCDTGRMYTLFAAPPEKDLEWSEQGIEGCARFLKQGVPAGGEACRPAARRANGSGGANGFGDGDGEGKGAGAQGASDAEARDERFRGALAFQYVGGADHGTGERAAGAGAAGRRSCAR